MNTSQQKWSLLGFCELETVGGGTSFEICYLLTASSSVVRVTYSAKTFHNVDKLSIVDGLKLEKRTNSTVRQIACPPPLPPPPDVSTVQKFCTAVKGPIVQASTAIGPSVEL